ncbi:MAG: UvrD-helicase domain-containing protein [Clostridia bacterium]|nr:UvrD-helicase domain-containing protein [Clostridia bacterium]
MNWTREQQQAIELRGNGIVSAAAGAGKTAVLTERVVQLCLSGIPLKRMLVLTFTRAAAAEMKERIALALSAAARVETSREKRDFLFEQVDNLSSADISTIHSFCRRIITRHFQAAELPPAGRTMDEIETDIMKRDAMDRALTLLAEENPKTFKAVLSAFDSEAAAASAVSSLYEFLTAQPDKEGFLKRAVEELSSPQGFEEDERRLLILLSNELRLLISDYAEERRRVSPSFEAQLIQMDDELTRLRGCLICQTLDEYLEAIAGAKMADLRFPRGTPEHEKAAIRKARQAIRELCAEQLGCVEPDRDKRRAIQRESAAALKNLETLYEYFCKQYAQIKAEKQVTDFSDLEHLALAALSDERVAAEYREGISEIIVDEYQDSNRVQEAILQRVSRGNNLFFVGDVKQSIYGFRLAEPRLFLEKLQSYKTVLLSHNFRSSEAILDLVNHVFFTLMRQPLSSVNYGEEEALKAGREQPQGRVAFHLIEGTDSETNSFEAQAALAAREIIRLKAEGYRYSDIAVLLRNMTHAGEWAQTLKNYGIPCFAQMYGGYFDSVEVMQLLNLLRLIDNRRQDIPLLSVLRSPFFGFSDERLALLREGHSEGDLLDCLEAAAERGEQDARDVISSLDFWREESFLSSVSELVELILDGTAFYDEMGALLGGEQRQKNLDALIDKAAAFDRIEGGGVHEFIGFMEGAEKNARMGAAQQAQSDVVQIMTIHRAKGLEFPAVILGGLESRFVTRELSNALTMHNRCGIALRYIEGGTRIRREPLRSLVIKKETKSDQLAEEMRVLYVALTRAKRELIMIATQNRAEETLSELQGPTLGRLFKASSYKQWLLYALKDYIPIEVSYPHELGLARLEKETAKEPCDPALIAALNTRFAWEYPHSAETRPLIKTSVTRQSREDLEFAPLFSEQETAVPLQRGTATHALLQQVGSKTPTREELSTLVQTDERFKGAYIDDVLWFTSSPLFGRMQAADRFERELPFSYADYDEFSENRLLMQGIIDACFVEEGAWVLLDYKTDSIDAPIEEVARRHIRQVELYANALTTLTALPVKERYVVLLRAHEAVRL